MLYSLLSYVNYWLHVENEHSLHAPFIYDFYSQVIKNDNQAGPFEDIERLRSKLINSNKKISVSDFGAGSRISKSTERSISSIVKAASTPPRFSRLLHRVVGYLNVQSIVELGTSFGINSLYLSNASSNGQLFTLEGCPETAKIASQNFDLMDCPNIEMIVGNIDDTLPILLQKTPKIDLAYIDANHRYQPTLNYFELLLKKCHAQSCIIIDDIHWSKEMNAAWKAIIRHPATIVSIDLFEAGIIFIDPKLQKSTYTLSF